MPDPNPTFHNDGTLKVQSLARLSNRYQVRIFMQSVRGGPDYTAQADFAYTYTLDHVVLLALAPCQVNSERQGK